MTIRSFPWLLIAALAAAGALFAACGGDSAVSKPGPLTCDTFANDSFRYTVHVFKQVGNSPDPNVPDYYLKSDIQGSYQGGKAFDATVDNADGVNVGHTEIIQLDDGSGFTNTRNKGWVAAENTAARPLPLRYRPADLCTALSPDVDTSTLSSVAVEDVNGVSTHKYTLTNVPSEFMARIPDFGSSSDIGANVKVLSGTVWVAEKGNYLSKLDISGTGQGADGTTYSIQMTFEVSDLGTDIKVSAPNLGSPAPS
jgi:hypothetical protein